MLSFNKSKFSFSLQNGFTVVELMVTITIVVLVTGLVMLRYSSFNSSVLLTSQAYITAFDIREAQSLAVSVRGNSNEFREEYGIYFTLGLPNSYQLFQDNDEYGEHVPVRYSPNEVVGAPFKVDSRFSIVNICGTNTLSRTCYTDDPETEDETVDSNFTNVAVSFKRPDFDAAFYSTTKTNLNSVEIFFGNEGNPVQKVVKVYTSGQVTVE